MRTESNYLCAKGNSFRDIENSVNLPMQIKDNKVEVGVSFGVAIYPDDGEDFDALLRAADEEMYKANHRCATRIGQLDRCRQDAKIDQGGIHKAFFGKHQEPTV